MPLKYVILSREIRDWKDESVSVIFFHVLQSQIVVGSSAFAETPSAGLPEPILSGNVLSPAETQALDTGQAVWRPASVARPKGADVADMKALIDAAWAESDSKTKAEVARRYSHYGTRDDEL